MMTTRIGEIIEQLFIAARDHPSGGKARLKAALYHRNKLLAMGQNSYQRTHPFQKRYGSNSDACYVHAEISAILNARRAGVDTSRTTLYIARARLINDQWQYGMARPCPGCERAIRDNGIRRVIFSLNESGYGTLDY